MAGAPALTTYREGSLHAALKALYTRPGDLVEEAVDGHVVDVARDDEVVEIQTGSFASAARKLRHLVGSHRIALVYPIALERWLVRVDADGVVASRRRSPRRGTTIDLFEELVAFPELLAHPGFRLELVLIKEEELRGPIPEGARYRHPRLWWRLDRRLLEVVDTVRVDTPTDLLGLLPAGLPDPFTSADIEVAGRCSKRIAMRAAYCLRRSGAISIVGKSGRLHTYTAVAGEHVAGHSRVAEAPGQ
ncbi:MAG: hypothetical protein ACXWNI_04475 [Candidatus Limnocylindrales bacterium]